MAGHTHTVISPLDQAVSGPQGAAFFAASFAVDFRPRLATVARL
jgi:hypothetical protein